VSVVWHSSTVVLGLSAYYGSGSWLLGTGRRCMFESGELAGKILSVLYWATTKSLISGTMVRCRQINGH